MFFFSMCAFLANPAQQEQIVKLVCKDMGADSCDGADVTAAASLWVEYTNTISGVVSLFTAGTLGAVADVYGRRPVLVISALGTVVQFSLNALADGVLRSAWQGTLVVGSTLYGLTGGFPVTLMALFAYAADTTQPRQRAVVFTIMECSNGIGAVLGQGGSGYLASRWGNVSAFYFGIVGMLLCLAYCVFIIPESLEAANRTLKFEWRRANTLGALRVLICPPPPPPRDLQGRHVMPALASVFFLVFLAFMGAIQVLVLYSEQLFNWSSATVGYFLSVNSGASSAFALVIVKILEPRMRNEVDEVRVVQAATVLAAFTFAAMGVIRDPVLMFVASGVLGIPVGMPFGFLRGLLSKGMPAAGQGLVLSAVCALEIVCFVVAPLLFNGLYAVTAAWSPGFCLFLMSGLSVLAVVGLSLVVPKRSQGDVPLLSHAAE